MENELGKFLEELRGKMSLRKAAEKSGLSHTYIRDLELGVNRVTKTPIKVTPESLKKLSEAYNYSYDELMIKAGYISDPDEVPPHLKKVYEEGILELIIDNLFDAVSKEFPDSTENDIDFTFNDKLMMFSNITDKGKKIKVVRNKDGTINVLYEVDEEYVLDLNDESLASKMDLYYDGMPLTNEEKVEFLAIARGIFSARRALREKQ